MRTSRRSKLLSSGFFVVLVALVGVGYQVGLDARDAILESQSGSISQFTLDPGAPGFRAFTTPTPTALVVHTAVAPTGGADLIGVTVLTSADEGLGGTVITIPRTFVDPDGSNVPLAEIFITQGLDPLAAELRGALGIGFGDVVVLDASSWTTLMRADLPLDLTLRDDLMQVTADGQNQVVLAAGTRPFDLPEVARIAAHRNAGEPALAVALRHQQVWRSWISRTAGSAERPALFQLESGFVELISGLASGEASYRVIPATTVAADNAEETTYVGESEAIDQLIAAIVPFPEPAEAGERPEVLLLDATFGRVDSAPVIEAIVLAGGRVTILGNTEAGSTASSEVQVHEEAATEIASEIARLTGLDAPTTVPLEDATAAITVIIGADQPTGQ